MSTPLIIANTLSLDLESSRQFNNEYQYQPGRTKKPLYTVGDDYFCVSKTKPTDDCDGEWEQHKDQFFAAKAGTILWVSCCKQITRSNHEQQDSA